MRKTYHGHLICVFLMVLLSTSILAYANGNNFVFLGFKAGEKSSAISAGWKYVTYPLTNENSIALLNENGRFVLHVRSMGSASGLLKDVDANIAKYPVLVWRWKINRTVGMAVENVKDRNDCSARIRVIFGPGKTVSAENTRAFEGFFKLLGISSPFSEPSGYKIDYIWANRAEKDSIVDYPGSTRHKMIVMESGNEKANGWLWERRDMVGDFKKCFGIDPPGIAGIIVLTDTDQTNEGVEAWYESIVLAKESAFCPE